MACKLTKKIVDGAKYEGENNGFYAIWDINIPGLGVRIYPSGKKSLIMKYRSMGRQRIYTIGRYGPLTLEQGKDKARKLIADMLDGKDPMEEKKRNIKSPTVKSLCNDFMERHSKVHKKTWKKDKERIDKHILPIWKNHKVKTISREMVSSLHRKIGKTRPYLANRILEILSKMFDLAIEWGYLEENSLNPAKRIKKFREEKRDRWVTPEEMPKLAKEIDKEENIYVRGALWLYLLTGVRKSELLKAKWEHVDFIRKELKLPDTKSGRVHYVPLSNEAIAIFKDLPELEENPYVLPGRKRKQHLVNIEKPWRQIREKAGCPDVRLHDLRRTVGSWLAQSGNSLLTIQKALNHSTTAATLVYARMSENPVRKALDEHAKRIMAAVKQEKGVVVELKKGAK